MKSNKEFKLYLVYVIKNLIDGKVYVGCHMTNNEDDGYLCSSKNKHFWNAIRKYEPECKNFSEEEIKSYYSKNKFKNFEKITIQYSENQDSMFESEVYWVSYYRETLGKENVYNISKGGNGAWHNAHTVDADKKRVETQKANGSYQRFQAAGSSPESRKKAVATMNARGTNVGWKIAVIAAQTEEVKKKRLETITKSGELDRWIKSGNSPEARLKAKERYYFLDEENKLHLMDRSNAKRHHKNWIQLESESTASEELKQKYIADHNITN